jgi:nucleotide-binding universal stress UspA family protein
MPVHANESEVQEKIQREVAEPRATASPRPSRWPAAELAELRTESPSAVRDQADLIVVGIRGHPPLAGLLLGGVTQRLLHIAPCPVLAVSPAHDPRD